MSKIGIHQLPAAGSLTGSELVPVDDGTATVRTTVAAIRAGAPVHSVAGRTGAVTLSQADVAGLTTASTPSFQGLTVATSQFATGKIELGVLGSGDRFAFLDMHASDAPSALDYSARVLRNPGANGSMALLNTGASGIEFWAASGLQVTVVATASANRNVQLSGSNGGDPTIGVSGGRLNLAAVPVLPGYTVATLPTAAARSFIYVSDGSGSRRLAVADGSNWRWPDGTLVA